MEKFFESLPKPVLALFVIVVALVIFALYDPPHTVCDVQIGNLKEDMKGQIFPAVVNKHNLPPELSRTQDACQEGNSAGSCYEYFSILKKVTRNIRNYSSECRNELASITEIKKAMQDGVLIMGKIAWGSHPPDPGMARYGWFQESELALFCQLKDIYSQSFGDEAWNELRLKVFKELPGESVPGNKGATVAVDASRATTTMVDKDMWARSVFSIRCENYR